MKKYILSLLIVGLSFIGFSYAGLLPDLDFSISGTDNTYFSSCNNYGCSYESPDFILFSCSGNGTLSFNYNNGSHSNSYHCPFVFSGYVNGKLVTKINFIYRENHQSDFVIHYKSSATPSGYLSPVVNGLKTSINEFIPYIVYIGLGILGVLIGFYAIKRLLRYVKGSTFSVFSSRRKK